jgi:hypothetical protein
VARQTLLLRLVKKATLLVTRCPSLRSPPRTSLGLAERSNALLKPSSRAPTVFSPVGRTTPRSTATFPNMTRTVSTSLTPCPRQGVCLMASPATLLLSALPSPPRAVLLARSSPSQSRTLPLLRPRSPCPQLLFHRTLVRRRLLPPSTSSINSALMRRIYQPSLVVRDVARARRVATVNDLADAARTPVLVSKAVSAKMRATVVRDVMVATWVCRLRSPTLVLTLSMPSQLLLLAVPVSSSHPPFLTRTRRGSVELTTHGHLTNFVCFSVFLFPHRISHGGHFGVHVGPGEFCFQPHIHKISWASERSFYMILSWSSLILLYQSTRTARIQAHTSMLLTFYIIAVCQKLLHCSQNYVIS